MITKDNFTKKASDWKVASAIQVVIADDLAAGGDLFVFQSAQAGYSASFVFFGGGIGEGYEKGSWSGIGLPALTGLAWSPLHCDRDFSASDLDGALGMVASASASFMFGGGFMYVAAEKSGSSLFWWQPCHGWGAGVGAQASVLVGIWLHLGAGEMQR